MVNEEPEGAPHASLWNLGSTLVGASIPLLSQVLTLGKKAVAGTTTDNTKASRGACAPVGEAGPDLSIETPVWEDAVSFEFHTPRSCTTPVPESEMEEETGGEDVLRFDHAESPVSSPRPAPSSQSAFSSPSSTGSSRRAHLSPVTARTLLEEEGEAKGKDDPLNFLDDYWIP